MDYHKWLAVMAVAGAALTMILGLIGIFWQLHTLNRGFGQDSLRALGTIMFIPTLLILAVVTSFDVSTLAALFGTIAGYILSTTPPDKPG